MQANELRREMGLHLQPSRMEQASEPPPTPAPHSCCNDGTGSSCSSDADLGQEGLGESVMHYVLTGRYTVNRLAPIHQASFTALRASGRITVNWCRFHGRAVAKQYVRMRPSAVAVGTPHKVWVSLLVFRTVGRECCSKQALDARGLSQLAHTHCG